MSRCGSNWYSQLWPSWAWTENFQLTDASQENQRALCTSSRDLISLNFIPESWDKSNWHGSNSLGCFVVRILKLSWAQKEWVLLSFSNVCHGWGSREWWHRCHTFVLGRIRQSLKFRIWRKGGFPYITLHSFVSGESHIFPIDYHEQVTAVDAKEHKGGRHSCSIQQVYLIPRSIEINIMFKYRGNGRVYNMVTFKTKQQDLEW